jgi:hypothetical protein
VSSLRLPPCRLDLSELKVLARNMDIELSDEEAKEAFKVGGVCTVADTITATRVPSTRCWRGHTPPYRHAHLLTTPLCDGLQVLDEDGSRYIELPEFAKLYQDQVRLVTCSRQPQWLSIANHSRNGLEFTKPVPVIAAEEARQRAHAMREQAC